MNEQKFKQIAEIINKWDPIGLFPLVPQNEYYDEVKLIVNYVEKNRLVTEEELSEKIKSIFLEAFGGEDVYCGKNCEVNIARDILACYAC